MKDRVTAGRYARAVTECADGVEELETLCGELSSFASVYEDDSMLRKLMAHPGIPFKKKENVLLRISKKMKLSEKCTKALAVILENGRINILPEIAASFVQLADEKLHRVRVGITSAFPLETKNIQKLEKTFSDITGKDAKVEAKENKSLIGGIVARVGSRVYDGSISNQLHLMKVKLEGEA